MVKQKCNENMIPTSDSRLELDTAATMFTLAFCDSHRALIRLTVTMSESVDRDKLQTALNRLVTRFPSFFVRLSHDQCRYFFESLDCAPIILEEAEADEPLFMTLDNLSRCAFRIIVSENRIALEYSHAVSDGHGGSVFLKSLIAEYLHIRYAVSVPYCSDVLSANGAPNYNEIKDAYQEITGASSKLKDMSEAYSLKGSKDKKANITELSFKTDDLLNCASECGVTLTALLSGVLTAALFDLQQRENREQREIRLSIPIDLRKRFSSGTLRNFTLPTTIYAGKLGDGMHVSALCRSFDKQLKMNVCKENLSALATSYVKMAKSKAIAALPLFFKRWVIQTFFSISKGGNCMTFSNLGIWRIPDNMKPYVQRCSMVFSPKPSTPYSCGMVSVGNDLTLTLTRSIREPLLEPRVLQILKKILTHRNARLELIA
ncbi:MAG: hypothetical protein ACOX0U_09240 [Oscillospiraceae bacterium]|jgi:NRPS condensation-like uncharacterized protein